MCHLDKVKDVFQRISCQDIIPLSVLSNAIVSWQEIRWETSLTLSKRQIADVITFFRYYSIVEQFQRWDIFQRSGKNPWNWCRIYHSPNIVWRMSKLHAVTICYYIQWYHKYPMIHNLYQMRCSLNNVQTTHNDH